MALCFGKVSIGAVSEDKVIDLHAKTEQLTLEVGFFERTFTMAGLPNAKR